MSSRQQQTMAYGAAGNRATRGQSNTERDPGADTVRGTTISFTASATIADSANGLGVYAVGDRIEVRGSALNSRVWVVTAAAAGSLTVVPAMIQAESAGPTIVIKRVS